MRILTTKAHSASEALSKLRATSLARVTAIHSCPVFATGRAISDIPQEDLYQSGVEEDTYAISGACHAMLNLTVNAKGNIFPCCAGVDQTDGLAIWNVRNASLSRIVSAMQVSPLHRTLAFSGVSTFLPILEAAKVRLKPSYRNMCEFCVDVFSRKEAMSRCVLNEVR